jgi:hypothetical protein
MPHRAAAGRRDRKGDDRPVRAPLDPPRDGRVIRFEQFTDTYLVRQAMD